jgi:hypothetical protein
MMPHSFFDDVDGKFGTIALRKSRLGLEGRRHDPISSLVRVAPLIELEQFGR